MMVIKRYILPILFTLILSVAGIGFSSTPAHAMNSVIFAGSSAAVVNGNVTRYNSVAGGSTTWGSATGQSQIVSTTGKIKNLYVELSGAAGTGADDTYTFTLMYNGAGTALTCAIVQGSTSGSDTTNEIDVVAGKLIILRCVSSGSPDLTPTAQWSMMFSGTTASESLILGVSSPGTSTFYFPISHGQSGCTVAETNSRQVCPTSGTIKNLYLSSTGATGTSWAIAVNKNSVATALTATLNCNGTSSNTTASFTVVAGDTLSVTSTATSVTAEGLLQYGMTFVANTDGESIILGGSNQSLDTANTVYNTLSTGIVIQIWTTEASVQHLGQVCQLKNLYVLIDGSPGGSGKSYDFTVMSDNGTASTITCQLANTTVNNSDTTHTATLANGNNISLRAVPTGTPTARRAFWGLVCYMYPAITNAPDVIPYGILETNTTSNTTINYFTITNTGTVPVDVTVQGQDLAGGDDTWDLTDDASIGENIYGLEAGLDDADDLFDIVVKESVANTLVTNLAISGTQAWGLKLYMPSSVTGYDGQQMTGNVTLVGSAH